MLRSMYSGISGLKNFQTKLDVIGNNISNVNTYGFKKGRTIFKDLVSQTTTGASGPSIRAGGVNPKQVGLGSQLAAIDTIHGTGSLQTSPRILDLAISGEGMFMVADSVDSDGPAPTPTLGQHDIDAGFSNYLYTRAGNFYMDKNGYLVNSEGKYLVGIRNTTVYDESQGSNAVSNFENDRTNFGTESLYDTTTGAIDTTNVTSVGGAFELGPIKIPTNAESMSISQDGTVSYVDTDGKLQFAGQLLLANFPNEGGLEKLGGNYYQTTVNSGNPFVQNANSNGMGSIESGFLEMSNVDLSEEFTDMIVAQRGFQANSRIITTSDQILEELVNLKR